VWYYESIRQSIQVGTAIRPNSFEAQRKISPRFNAAHTVVPLATRFIEVPGSSVIECIGLLRVLNQNELAAYLRAVMSTQGAYSHAMFWARRTRKTRDSRRKAMSDEISKNVFTILDKHAKLLSGVITDNTVLEDIGLESLEIVECIFDLEEAFDITIPNPGEKAEVDTRFKTAGDVVVAVRQLMAQPVEC